MLPLLAFAQSGSKISQELSLKMAANPEAYQEVLVALADYVDAGALLYKYETERTPLQQRSFEVITLLQEKANATQPPVLARLNTTDGIEKGSVSSVWIVNLIYVRANAKGIEQMDTWPEVGEIYSNYAVENDFGTNVVPSVSTPNGSEPGLRAIKAPFMWNKGYTGYSRKGLIIDTGQDGDHPALISNFWGNEVPVAQAWHGTEWPEDCADHGSHVAGTVCGIDRKTNDTIGVAFNAHWLGGPMFFPINTEGTGCSHDFTQTIFTNISSLQWALNPDGNAATLTDQPDIINNSWRSGNVDCGITSAINILNSLEAAGIAVVWAQGNAGPDPSTVTSGAALNMALVNSFAVGAVNGASPSFPIADFSSRGPSTCGGTGALAIKPEVAAPGVSVRSAFDGGIYSSIDGTSMAAPHASGALLLLKEAFPSLSGMQLKLALYNSATDLGAAGEDNAYGKGMINLESAFNYLVNEGNTPVPPAAFDLDAILADLKVAGLCNGPVDYTVGFENSGTTTITALQFSYGVENGPTTTYDWTGSLAPKAYLNVKLPALTGITPGEYTAVASITSVNGQSDNRPLNNNFKVPFTMNNDDYATASINSIQTLPICSGARVLLTYNTDLASNESPQWFASATGGTALSEGKSFLTPVLSQNATYYVSSISRYNVGKTTISGSSSNSNGAALEFDALKAFRIKSVKVLAEETGARIIEVIDNLDQVVATKTVSISQVGEQRITLNLNIPKGNDYQIRLAGGKNLKQTSSNGGYPHTIQNIVSIVRGISATGVSTTSAYYYFFDWEIELPLICERTAVPVTVSPSPIAPSVSFSFNPDTVVLAVSNGVTFTDLTQGTTTRFWDFGNGQSSTDAQPSTTYMQEGNYKAYLVAATANGCSSAGEKTVVVLATSDAPEVNALQDKAVIYPNPANDQLNIAFVETYAPVGADIVVHDLLGKTVLVKRNAIQNETTQVDISTLYAGVYFVHILQNGEMRWAGKFIKQ